MKRLAVAFLIVLLFVFTQSVSAQQTTVSHPYSTTVVAADIALNLLNTGVQYHQLVWTTTGTVGTCSVRLDLSDDASTWSTQMISAQTCTTPGHSLLTAGVARYVRINVTTKTGSGTVTVVYQGFIGSPSAIPVVFPGAPSGACNPNQTAVNTATGHFFTCLAGVWTDVSAGGITGAGVANRLASWSGAAVLTSDIGLTTPTSATITLGRASAGNQGILEMYNGTTATPLRFMTSVGQVDENIHFPAALGTINQILSLLSASGNDMQLEWKTPFNPAAPGTIGGTTPAAATFTALNATSIPSAGAIGGTTPAAGAFTTIGGTIITASTDVAAPFLVSTDADPADAGFTRAGNAECHNWEASPAGTDFGLCGNTSEQIVTSASIVGSNDGGKDLGSVNGGFGTVRAYAMQAPNAANPAGVGLIRIDNNSFGPTWRNQANTADVATLLTTSNVFLIDIEAPTSSQGIAWGTLNAGATGQSKITHSSMIFEGPTMDASETTINIAEPTADRTQTIPDIDGTFTVISDCTDSAGAAACSAATSGSVVIDAGATTVVVSTTAVLAGSRIFLQYDSSLGTRLGVTCNTTVAIPQVTARTAGTSFTITVPAGPITNPACYNFLIVNGV